MKKSQVILLSLIFAAAMLVKTLPYFLSLAGLTDVKDITSFIWNFSPIMALFLFCGAQVTDRRWAYAVPLASMLVSDIVIALILGEITEGLLPGIPVVYGTYALVVWGGSWIPFTEKRLEKRSATFNGKMLNACLVVVAAILLGIGGEVSFFLTTNFTFWASQTGFYAHTLPGLGECYVAAIPFLKHALPSTLVYSGALFGGMAAVNLYSTICRLEEAKRDPAAAAVVS